MKTEEKMNDYTTPKIEVIEVEVEKGFAASPDNGDGTDLIPGGWS